MTLMFASPEIHELPLSSPRFMERLERFLAGNGLRYEAMDKYFAVYGEGEELLAGAGIKGDVIKCVAVSETCRSEGFTVPVLSRLISDAAARGITELKVFTKPEYESIFSSLGFRCIARAPKAILMENGRGLEEYCDYLRSLRRPGRNGVVVMNANPTTHGHQWLLEDYGWASDRPVDNLYVIPVKEDLSMFSYQERKHMLARCALQPDTILCEGSGYAISALTFPTYFLKDLSDAAETQMRLDLDLFGRHFAPALGVSVRLAGTEPEDPLTARYNELMKEILPSYNVEVLEVPRYTDEDGVPYSASRVRKAISAGSLSEAFKTADHSALHFICAELARRALSMELDARLKPGLVCPDSCGAHSDMDYTVMQRSISAIRARFGELFLNIYGKGDIDISYLMDWGKETERKMLEATGGINTHRGSIFSLGLSLAAAFNVEFQTELEDGLIVNPMLLEKEIVRLAGEMEFQNQSAGGRAHSKYGAKSALQMAREGYRSLFEDWLPFYRSLDGDDWRLQKTLLRIMSSLDDTCVIHRVGYERAQDVKREAAGLIDNWSIDSLEYICASYAAEGISPGGAADMLALTIFIDSILN